MIGIRGVNQGKTVYHTPLNRNNKYVRFLGSFASTVIQREKISKRPLEPSLMQHEKEKTKELMLH
jgi:hypothetical protein